MNADADKIKNAYDSILEVSAICSYSCDFHTMGHIDLAKNHIEALKVKYEKYEYNDKLKAAIEFIRTLIDRFPMPENATKEANNCLAILQEIQKEFYGMLLKETIDLIDETLTEYREKEKKNDNHR